MTRPRWVFDAVFSAMMVWASATPPPASAQTVEFDVRVTTVIGDRPAIWLNGYELVRASLRDGDAATPSYREDIGYVFAAGGVVRVALGVTDPGAFTAAVGLDGPPDDNRVLGDVRVELERCTRRINVLGPAAPDACRDEDAWEPWLSEDLRAAPVAMTVMSVPLSALPAEVAFSDDLDAAVESLTSDLNNAIAAERAARQAADAAEAAARDAAGVAATAALDAEHQRALVAEAKLTGDLDSERQARQLADAAEATARMARDDALAAEVAAVAAGNVADGAAL